jgi:hypothetical protein
VSVTLWDFGGTVFGSDALPQSARGLTLAMFVTSSLRWDSPDGALTGRLDALACAHSCLLAGNPPAVPEPASVALVLAGLGAVSLTQRRRYQA